MDQARIKPAKERRCSINLRFAPRTLLIDAEANGALGSLLSVTFVERSISWQEELAYESEPSHASRAAFSIRFDDL